MVTQVHHEITPVGTRIRVHTMVVPLEISVPKEQVQPFSAELPDLFGTDEACRVVSAAELSAIIDGLKSQGIARQLFQQTVDVADSQHATWKTEWHSVEDGTITPTLREDGTIRVTFSPPKAQPGSFLDSPSVATHVLGKNETLVIAGSARSTGASQSIKTPILSDIPWIGERFFTSRKVHFRCAKVMYLVSCEVVR